MNCNQVQITTLDNYNSAFARKDIIRRDPGASLVVVSSDGQLIKVVQANGLLVENPEGYP